MHLHLTVLSPPLNYLPYLAVEFRGIWTMLQIDPEIQLTIIVAMFISEL